MFHKRLSEKYQAVFFCVYFTKIIIFVSIKYSEKVYNKIDKYRYNCENCATPCGRISKLDYQFTQDATFSESYEQAIINALLKKNISARKTQKAAYPDIEINGKNGEVEYYIEVKVQRRTFMSVRTILPHSNLMPSETIALNLSDLLRYIEIRKNEKKRIILMWVLVNRPCILGNNKQLIFYRQLSVLEKIYERERNKRRFRRQTGKGDIVNGEHKGVTVNYHFSLSELKEANLELIFR